MSDTAAPPTPAAPETAPAAPEAPPAEEVKAFDADYVAKLRQEAAKYRTEAKANADAAKKLADIEDANKSEVERTTERLRALEAELATERTEKLRMRIGAEKGLPAPLIGRLQGATEEEMAADADQLLTALTPAAPAAPDLKQGRQGDIAGPAQLTRADLVGMDTDDIEQARQEGRLNVVLGIK